MFSKSPTLCGLWKGKSGRAERSNCIVLRSDSPSGGRRNFRFGGADGVPGGTSNGMSGGMASNESTAGYGMNSSGE